MYRGVFLDEEAWDLFALLGVSGAITMVYLARHKVLGQLFGWRTIIGVVVTMVISAVVAAIVTMTKVR